MDELSFRKAGRDDISKILFFIEKIAEYEKMSEQMRKDPEMLEREIFDKKRAEVLFLIVNGEEIGFALYFFNFSTFENHSGLYLEDIFILEEYRHRGYGKKTFSKLCQIAMENGCRRMEWVCLKWNVPSLNFYQSLSAKRMDEDWATLRLNVDDIKRIAEEK